MASSVKNTNFADVIINNQQTMKKILMMAFTAGMMLALGACGNENSQDSTTGQGEEMYSAKYSATTVNPKEHKRVVIIEGSPRRGGNTDLLADEFARGAIEAGGSVYKYFLDDFDLKFFGEGDQQRMGQNPMETDEVEKLVLQLVDADVIVLSCPVYFLNITGQMKTFIDRTFSHFMEIKDKEFYYITACADPIESTANYAIEGFRGFTKCIPNPTERGYVKAIGMGAKGAVKGTKFMTEAYELGLSINK